MNLTDERLEELLSQFPKAKIAVLGDFFLDKYLDVDPRLVETSVETGKEAHQVVDVRCSPGAAGTVVSNLASLDAGEIYALGLIGDDGEGFDLRKGLVKINCRTEHLIVTPHRCTPTYLKPRDQGSDGLEGEHSRYDTKHRTLTTTQDEDAILNALDEVLPNVDALIILDQVQEHDCGVVTTRVQQAICERASRQKDVVFWADSRARVHEFRHVIIKPNEHEVLQIENPLPGQSVDEVALQNAAQLLREKTDAPLVVTRGADGAMVSDPEWISIRGVRVDGPVDATGAGDSMTAGSVLALCAGATLSEAGLIGNLVASITIQQIATTGTAKREDLPSRLKQWRTQS